MVSWLNQIGTKKGLLSMAKNKWTKPKQAYDGFVYILAIQAPGGTIYKIGTTNRTVNVRTLEIAGELLGVLGHIPRIEILRQRQTKDNYAIEAKVLRETAKYRCSLGMAEWAGESELRRLDREELLVIYDKAIAEDYAPTVKFKVGL